MIHTLAIADRLPVLVCLASPRGLVLVDEILTREGFAVTAANTLSEFGDAMRQSGFRVIVTVSEAIEAIRRMSRLPLVNIRTFVHERADKDTGRRICLFDRAAFVGRVRLAAESRFPVFPHDCLTR
ncbi:hypothetical protein ACFFP0_08765 [Rhizobium puerariae]|uniref:Response regulatory domain-containing protein n=1 Tax=Rhizobium puerariae TaxID=1585791 RepID=A0ABV6AGE7_9HYPH